MLIHLKILLQTIYCTHAIFHFISLHGVENQGLLKEKGGVRGCNREYKKKKKFLRVFGLRLSMAYDIILMSAY